MTSILHTASVYTIQWNPGLTIFGITINIRLPSKSYSKMYGAEPRYNDIPGLTMGMSLTERKIFPVITIKSIAQTTGNAKMLKTVFDMF